MIKNSSPCYMFYHILVAFFLILAPGGVCLHAEAVGQETIHLKPGLSSNLTIYPSKLLSVGEYIFLRLSSNRTFYGYIWDCTSAGNPPIMVGLISNATKYQVSFEVKVHDSYLVEIYHKERIEIIVDVTLEKVPERTNDEIPFTWVFTAMVVTVLIIVIGSVLFKRMKRKPEPHYNSLTNPGVVTEHP
jgi:hypothetical protein